MKYRQIDTQTDSESGKKEKEKVSQTERESEREGERERKGERETKLERFKHLNILEKA